MITYCGSCGSTPIRSSAARMTIAPSSVALWDASPPPSLPNGVRTAETITARAMRKTLASEVELGLEPPCERGHEPDRRLDVVQRDHLARCVEVANRQRDQAGRNACAARVGRVHVGVGVSGGDVDGVRDALILGGRDEQLEHFRADRRAAVDDRAVAQLSP